MWSVKLAQRKEYNERQEREMELGNDLGDKVEILSRLDPSEPLVANPGGSLRDGADVKVQPQPTQTKKQQ
jgi:hypothetical protein